MTDKIDAKTAAQRLREAGLAGDLDMPPEDRHRVAFVRQVCEELGLPDSHENVIRVSRALQEQGIDPHEFHEYPKWVDREVTVNDAHEEEQAVTTMPDHLRRKVPRGDQYPKTFKTQYMVSDAEDEQRVANGEMPAERPFGTGTVYPQAPDELNVGGEGSGTAPPQRQNIPVHGSTESRAPPQGDELLETGIRQRYDEDRPRRESEQGRPGPDDQEPHSQRGSPKPEPRPRGPGIRP